MGAMFSRIINYILLWYNRLQAITNGSQTESTTVQTNKVKTVADDQIHTQNPLNEPRENLEIFSLIWCDIAVNSAIDSRHTQIKLRQIINFLITFNNIRDCLQYINEKVNEKIVLVISGQYGAHLVPLVNELQQIIAIYVYCDHKEIIEEWVNNFEKVRYLK
ncbi:unnamed protein product [Didymodactylos carnosus]|uniref:Uncharacterized protein n=1 Tax=Didymodactylos carnosus TaxID=1234261 RepID=A0A8S2UVC9_9BILA|nr:unnamed protein product [Didymodactylos carnosus]CAF4351744.1 unnamed protein product [Didymodactylos carnosus]